MSVFIFTLKKVFPLVLYIGLGMILRKTGQMDKQFALDMNTFVFKVLMPISIFLSTSKNIHMSASFLKVSLFAVISIIATCLLSAFYYRKKNLKDEQKTVLIQASFRANFGLFGIALSNSLLGAESQGITEGLLLFTIPLYNILTIILFSAYGEEKSSIKDIVINILKNPLVLGILFGYIANVINLTLPALIENPLRNLSSAASPLALVALGSGFTVGAKSKYGRYLDLAIISRLIIVPAIFLGIAAFLGFRGEYMVALLCLLASPVAVASYTMAETMGQDGKLAGQILAYTSVFCVFSLSFFIYFLKFFSFI